MLRLIQVTNTNSAEAIMYLQQSDWKLDRAIAGFFSKENPGSTSQREEVFSQV